MGLRMTSLEVAYRQAKGAVGLSRKTYLPGLARAARRYASEILSSGDCRYSVQRVGGGNNWARIGKVVFEISPLANESGNLLPKILEAGIRASLQHLALHGTPEEGAPVTIDLSSRIKINGTSGHNIAWIKISRGEAGGALVEFDSVSLARKQVHSFPPMVFGGKHLETIQEGGYTRKPVFLNSGNRALHYMSRYSTSGAPPVIVGVHGFSHALVDWERAAAEIAGQHGLDFVSMGLSGHYGTSQTSVWDYFSRTTLAGFAGQLRKDLIDVQARFPGMHLAIVAHSMGAPITAMALSMDQAEQGKLADNVSHFIPLSGIGLSQFRTRITPMFLWQIALNTASLLRMRAFALSPYGAWSAFLSKGISPTEFAGFWETHQQESCMVVWEFVRTLFPRWLPWVPYAPKLGLASGTKVTAVHIGGDPLISRESAIDLVEFFRAAGRDATLVDLSSPRASHDIMLTDPEGLARTVANIVSNART